MIIIQIDPPRPPILPFRSWVPVWLQCCIGIIILLSSALLNGAYLGSNVDISSSMGIMSEDITMAYYATAAGMAIAYASIPKIRILVTAKTVVLTGMIIQVVLSFICANTYHIELIVLCGFIIGVFKALALVEAIKILQPIFSSVFHTRNEFYSKYYPLTLAGAQISLYVTAQLTYFYKWQYMYYFMIIYLLITILVVSIFMKFVQRLIRLPFKDIDWLSFFLIAAFYLCLIFVTTYGKVKDWFNSKEIILATIMTFVTGFIFFRRQFMDKTYVDISLLKNKPSRTGYILGIIFLIFCSFSVLITTYTGSVLHIDKSVNNRLYLYMLPGFLTGSILGHIWFYKQLRVGGLIFVAFFTLGLSLLCVYFQVVPGGMYERLYIPMYLKGVSMSTMFIGLALYCQNGIRQDQIVHNGFFIIAVRSCVGPTIGSCILGNWLYHLKLKNISLLSKFVDMQNPLANHLYQSSYHKALTKGFNLVDAQRIATHAVYAKVQTQAIIESIKTISGWMLIADIVVMVLIIIYFITSKPVRVLSMDHNDGLE